MKLDLLAIAAHPDDAELSCSGTLLTHKALGKKVGIIDLTQGELGTRGSATLRAQEAASAAQIMGLDVRENLGLPDGFFQNNPESQLKLIHKLRKYRPEIVLANALEDRHPDHGRAAQLIADACFYSGLAKVVTHDEAGYAQAAWRPKHVFHFIQSNYIKPDLLVDISECWETKKEAILAYKSQFFNPEYKSQEAQTFISSPDFMSFIEGRALEFGKLAGVKYAEGFNVKHFLCTKNLFHFL